MPAERPRVADPAARRLREALERRGWLTRADAVIAIGGPASAASELLERIRPRPRMVAGLVIDPQQARLAERHLIGALRRMHRADPLAPAFRLDAVVARARAQADADRRPAGHRGAGRLLLDGVPLRALADALVASGRVERDGRRLRLAGREPALGRQMRGRADALLDELRAGGAAPPRAAAVARRLGLPEGVIAHLRTGGELVSLGPEIDYPADVYRRLRETATTFARRRGRPPSVAEYRSLIGASRRYAAALLESFGIG